MKDFERLPSGIPGLDKLMEGGFVKGFTILVSGSAGTGKTIFSLQFLLEGLKKGENCMYISLEQKPQDILDDVLRFGWDLQSFISKKKFFIEYHDPFQIADITSPIIDKIKEKKITRVAIDSTSSFGLYFKDTFEIRKQLYKLLTGLKEIGVTSILTTELTEEEGKLSRFGVEEFIVDGVVLLQFLGLGGKASFNIQVRKMRRTEHKKESYPYDITKNGIKIGSA
jgi:KaiC/GvpD/RAD55 family RecA-like ATPase